MCATSHSSTASCEQVDKLINHKVPELAKVDNSTGYEQVTDTHVFKPILAQLPQQMQEPNKSEPRAPQQHFVHVLHVNDSEHEDELVEDIVPELVFDTLRLGDSELPEDQSLDHETENGERAVSDVYQGLEQKRKNTVVELYAGIVILRIICLALSKHIVV